MKGVVLVLLALAWPPWLTGWWSETNSHAANARGVRAWAKREYADAAAAFARAQQSHPSATNAFNLGTAEIAAGDPASGVADLETAIADPALRADAFFNRGTGALAAKEFDRAVADLTQALKANPGLEAAKRNLEIALLRREAQRKTPGGQRNQQGESEGEKQKQPAPGEQEQQAGPMDVESLLRSVQQQEQEELRRMKGSAGEARVGW